MNETPEILSQRHRCLAYALGRVCLGTNIFLHGAVRIPHFGQFAAKLQHQFAETFLPASLVQASAYVIVGGEALIGFLLLIGWGLHGTLIAGVLLMLLLQIGTTLVQDWNAASQQLIYIGFYLVLLATIRYDCFSVNRWRV